MNIIEKEENLIIELDKRIDSQNAPGIDSELNDYIKKYIGKNILFDAGKMEYISSAGLRVLLKAQKNAGKPIMINNVSNEVYEIFDTTGFTQLFNVRKKFREISVDGCEIIGKGYYGTVYRIDEDTIVKKYESPEALAMIENEKRLAKIAFVAGIPTAISFDIVKIGNSYGSVFELLKAKTFNDLIIENPEKTDDILRQYCDLIKQVHSISLPNGTLPSAKQKFLEKLEAISTLLSETLCNSLKQFLTSISEDDHIVHGDIQMKNVMLSDGEPMLIDMDTLSQGLPIFDLAGLYLAYRAFSEDDPMNSMEFFGISMEMTDKIWDNVFNSYYFDKDVKERKKILETVKVLAYISLLSLLDNQQSELAAIRIKHSIEHLENFFK